MYVLVLARGYPTDQSKTRGIFEFDQAKALLAAGHKVVLACIDTRSLRRWRKWGTQSLIKEGIPIEIVNLPLGKVPFFISAYIAKAAFCRLYLKIAERHGKPMLIHAHFGTFARCALDVVRKEKLPFVVTEHASWINKANLSSRMKKRVIPVYDQTDALIAVSSSLADNLGKWYDKPVQIIPNIVNTELFEYREPKVNQAENFRFVSCGHLVAVKGFDLLIDAFASFNRNCPSCTLTIWGDGLERSSLQTRIDNLGASNFIILKGMGTREQIAADYQNAHAFVLASRSETFGLAYVEALAAGLPVIATRCGGPEDFVTKNNGLLIPPNDQKSLIEALESMLNLYKQYSSLDISRDVRRKYAADQIANQLSNVYKEIMQ